MNATLAIVLIAALAFGGSGGSGVKKPKPPKPPADDDGDLAGTQCPAGSPIVYDGPHLYGSDSNVPTPDLIPLERTALLEVIDQLLSDDGYPQPAVGLCTFEALIHRLKVSSGDGWPGVIAMLTVWRINYNGDSSGKAYTDLTGEVKSRWAVIKAAIEKMMAEDDDEYDGGPLDAPNVASSPTRGAWYRVKQGNTLLFIAGQATGAKAGSPERLAYAKAITLAPQNAASRKVAKLGSFDMKYLGGYTMMFTREYACADKALAPRGSGDCYPLIYLP